MGLIPVHLLFPLGSVPYVCMGCCVCCQYLSTINGLCLFRFKPNFVFEIWGAFFFAVECLFAAVPPGWSLLVFRF